MSPKEKIDDFKRKFKIRNALNIIHSTNEGHRDENGKIKKLKVYRFYFDRHIDIVVLWSIIFLSSLTFLIGTLLSPFGWWVKLILISVITLVACIMVLLSHEQLILIQRLNNVLENNNKENNH